ncbi:hypothetical protein [Pseudomonas sp. NA-150]|uniref:hypothetical protein n=1 Tax=Pseudomonas sp. NA-150 TaxID=3367525 RepID=UPI0037C9A39E
MRHQSAPVLLLTIGLLSTPVFAEQDLNKEILETVSWLAKNKSGLGYDLGARYSENLIYGDHVFRATKGSKTMCVAAVFETIIRTLQTAKDVEGNPVSSKLLPGSAIDGKGALNILPYVFQYGSTANFPEYGRKFSAGVGDAFVLFGIGRYVTFDTAKPGDFIYLNRVSGSGHAVVFYNYLGSSGKAVPDSKDASGFRYFSAQGVGTNGFGFRDAFFGNCPAVKHEFKEDCGVIKSSKRGTFSVSRLYAPSEWFTSYSAIRVERFFKGATIDTIFADEPNFRKRAKSELAEADAKARDYAKKGLFPLIVPAIGAEAEMAMQNLQTVGFKEGEFGPNFAE